MGLGLIPTRESSISLDRMYDIGHTYVMDTKSLILAIGRSDVEIAASLGVRSETVNRWRRGHKTPVMHIRKQLCRMAKVGVGDVDWVKQDSAKGSE